MTAVSTNVMELVWSKLIVNAGINALTAVLGVRNGELIRMDETKDLMRMAVLEAVEVAFAAGVKFDGGEMVRKVMGVAFATGDKFILHAAGHNEQEEDGDRRYKRLHSRGRQEIFHRNAVNSVLTKLVRALENWP